MLQYLVLERLNALSMLCSLFDKILIPQLDQAILLGFRLSNKLYQQVKDTLLAIEKGF